MEWKKNYWKAFIKKIHRIPAIPAHCSILDLGCGPAGIFIIFPENPVCAVDPLLNTYEKDLPHFDPKNYPGTEFITSSIEDFVYPGKFDFVFCLNAINHVDKIQKGFEKIATYLHKDSVLILSIDAHNHSFLKKIFQFLPGDILHPHQYDLKDYIQFLDQENLEVMDCIEMKRAFIFNYYVLTAKKKS